MWTSKNVSQIIYLDKERRLKHPPSIYGDNEDLPFRDGSIHTIYFDPPHGDRAAVKGKATSWFMDPQESKATFYNGYRSKELLFNYLEKSSEEFYRVLRDDGQLLLKWNETDIDVERILRVFRRKWIEVMRIPVCKRERMGRSLTWWIHMVKRANSHDLKMDAWSRDQLVREAARLSRSR